MSDERLQELGLHRREFLKRFAAGIFVAPVVVSFGLDSIAEGATRSSPIQGCANQPLEDAEGAIEDALSELSSAEDNGDIDAQLASVLRKKLLQAEADIASNDFGDAAGLLRAVQNQMRAQLNKRITQEPYETISSLVSYALAQLSCL